MYASHGGEYRKTDKKGMNYKYVSKGVWSHFHKKKNSKF